MDGTLVNSGTIISNTINHVRVNVGLEPMPKNILLENINNPHINPSEFFYETKEFTNKHSNLFEAYYDKHYLESIELYDSISLLLEKLKSENYILSIATNASSEFAIKITQHLDIFKYFDYIIGYDNVKEPKPAPDMINKTMLKLGFESSKSILVGDSQKDLLSAKSANIDSILVNWGFSNHQTDVCNNTDELYNKINLIFSNK